MDDLSAERVTTVERKVILPEIVEKVDKRVGAERKVPAAIVAREVTM